MKWKRKAIIEQIAQVEPTALPEGASLIEIIRTWAADAERLMSLLEQLEAERTTRH